MSGFTLEGDVLSLGPVATTRMACRGPEGAAEQARAFAQALAMVAGYEVEGDQLTLLTAEGTIAARFRAQEAEAEEPGSGPTSDPAPGPASDPAAR
jgi:heat shock protein HslJ